MNSIDFPSADKTLTVFAQRLGGARSAGQQKQGTNDATGNLPCLFVQQSSVCILPSLSIQHQAVTASDDQRKASASKSELDAMIADRMKAPRIFNKKTVNGAQEEVLKNISMSFGAIVDTCIRAAKRSLLKQILSKPPVAKRLFHERVLKELSQGPMPISLEAVVSRFRALPLSKGHVRNVRGSKGIVLPMVFKVSFHAVFLGERHASISFCAPGTITGVFGNPQNLLDEVTLVIDTVHLYRNMKKQANKAVHEVLSMLVSKVKLSLLHDVVSQQEESVESKHKRPCPSAMLSSSHKKIRVPVDSGKKVVSNAAA